MNDEPQGPQGPSDGPPGAQGPQGPRRRRRRSRRRSGARQGAGPDGAQQGQEGGGAPGESWNGQRPHGQRQHAGGNRAHQGGQGRQRQRGRRQHRGRRPWQRRGRGGEQWWARRWTDVLESFEVGRRLGRGRIYARQGQVLEMEIGQGFVTAQVQGSRDAPYLVRMRFSMLSSTDWKKVTKELAADPVLGPGLASGQMPEGVEEVFERLGLSLFPRANGDLKTACSCPDPANPCKHVAAVYYLLGEEIARDPYVLFRLRGLDRTDLVAALGGPLRGTPMPPPPPRPVEPERLEAMDLHEIEGDDEPRGEDEDDEAGDADAEGGGEDDERSYGALSTWADDPLEPEPPPQPLPAEPHSFWAGGNFASQQLHEARIPPVPAALTKRLGALPFARGEDPSLLLERIYRNASSGGLEVFLGERAEEE